MREKTGLQALEKQMAAERRLLRSTRDRDKGSADDDLWETCRNAAFGGHLHRVLATMPRVSRNAQGQYQARPNRLTRALGSKRPGTNS